MTTFENHPVDPSPRPERVRADKIVLADAVRTPQESAVPRHVGAWADAVGGAWRRRPAIASVSLAGTVAVIFAVVVALTVVSSPSSRPPSVIGSGSPRWELVSDASPSWHTLANAPYQPQFGLPGIGFTCPTTSTCYAVNFENPGPDGTSEVVVTTDGGQTWTPSTLPVTLSGPGPAAISCADASTCVLLGVDSSGSPWFLETTDGGRSWTQQAGPTGLGASFGTRIVCSSASTCVGVTGGGGPATATHSEVQVGRFSPFAFATTDGGATWTTSSLPNGFLPNDLQCSSSQVCVASGGSGPVGAGTSGNFSFTTNGGSTWRASTSPAAASLFGGLHRASCAGAESCLAITDGLGSRPTVLTSTDGGATWTALAPIGLPTGFITSLSCAGARDCWVSGVTTGSVTSPTVGISSPGFVAFTSDGGATWQTSPLPSGIGAVMALSCPTATTCFALAAQQSPSGDVNSGQPFVVLAYGAVAAATS